MSTELVVLNNTQIAETIVEDNGNWGEEEVSRPQFIAMKQALTEGMDHIPNGTFFHKASGQTWTTINMIVLDMHKTRHLKPSAPAYVQGEKDLCASRNGKFPILGDDRLVPQAHSCLPDANGVAQCEKNSWAGYDKGSKTGPKPLCQKGFYFLFLDEETGLPYIYETSGQGVDPSEAVYEAIRARAKVVKAKTGRMPNTYDFVVTMISEKGNKAFKPKFTTVRQLTPEAAAKFGPLYQQFVTSRQGVEPEPVADEYVASADTGAVLEGEVVAI